MNDATHDRADGKRMLERYHRLAPTDPQREECRNQLVAEFLPLVHYLARKMTQRSELLEDVTQVGSIGLLNAIDRFDPARGVEFTTFAVPTIAGEIRRYFRDTGWCLHVPRRALELQSAIREAEAALSQELGRSPTLDEVAARLDVSPESVIEAKDVADKRTAVSTDVSPLDDDANEPMRIPSVEDGYERAEARAILQPALSKLAKREQAIIMLRFYGERTQAEIASLVGVSQMQVSRLITRSLGEMREAMGVDDRIPA